MGRGAYLAVDVLVRIVPTPIVASPFVVGPPLAVGPPFVVGSSLVVGPPLRASERSLLALVLVPVPSLVAGIPSLVGAALHVDSLRVLRRL